MSAAYSRSQQHYDESVRTIAAGAVAVTVSLVAALKVVGCSRSGASDGDNRLKEVRRVKEFALSSDRVNQGERGTAVWPVTRQPAGRLFPVCAVQVSKVRASLK